MVRLQEWRKRQGLTQVEAAGVLGVSQPYLSLLEKGSRPVTPALRQRMRTLRRVGGEERSDETWRAQLAALGYPGFAHVTPARVKARPDALLWRVLSRAQVEARVIEAMPWLVREYAADMDFRWLVRQAKLGDGQNRVGFVLALSGVQGAGVKRAMEELAEARLLKESTLGWEAMPEATREWMREHRSETARYWNVVTRMVAESD